VIRNSKVFLRDRTALFFSFLSVFIIILVYAVFLGNTTTQSVRNMAGGDIDGIRWLVDSWIMAGILVVTTITVPMGVFGMMVEDNTNKRLDGFRVAPISRQTIVFGYLLTAWLIGMMLSMITFGIAMVYIAVNGGQWMSLSTILKSTGIIALNIASGASITFLLTMWVRTSGSYSTLATVIGTVIGFLTGIYIPVGILPDGVQIMTRLIPATHGAALLRQIFMAGALDRVFLNAPPNIKAEFMRIFGVTIPWGNGILTQGTMVFVLVFSVVIFVILSTIVMNRKNQ
jgi:multidrug/hemolysin transport system permease protein